VRDVLRDRLGEFLADETQVLQERPIGPLISREAICMLREELSRGEVYPIEGGGGVTGELVILGHRERFDGL